MKIAVLGAGFTGLAAGLRLLEQGHEVILIEKEAAPGGLAGGFKLPGWNWTLEKSYHHWFTNDEFILKLAQQVGQKVLIQRPQTNVFINGQIKQFDSPLALLKFSPLPFIDRLRTGVCIAYLKYFSDFRSFEGKEALPWIKKFMGEKVTRLIWEPLFLGKFGDFAPSIALTWFWGRIKKRTPDLAYPEGGFQTFADKLAKSIIDSGGAILFNSQVSQIESQENQVSVNWTTSSHPQSENFDKVISTLPSPIFTKISKKLPISYANKISSIPHLSALNLILILKKPFLRNSYWLNITNTDFPFLVLAEHTNFMDPKHYNNQHVLYIGNYLPENHPYLKMSAKQLLDKFTPYLSKINPNFKFEILNFKLFTSPYAQPIVDVDYQNKIPQFQTPLKNIYSANMDMVYPWDRETNYAAEMGDRLALNLNENLTD